MVAYDRAEHCKLVSIFLDPKVDLDHMTKKTKVLHRDDELVVFSEQE